MSLSEPLASSPNSYSSTRRKSSGGKPLHRLYLSAVRRLMSNDSSPLINNSSNSTRAAYFSSSASAQGRSKGESSQFGDVCPSCRMPFDKAKKRRLVDTCGHERCYACMFRNETCPICSSTGSSPAKFSKSSSGNNRPISVLSNRSSNKSGAYRTSSPSPLLRSQGSIRGPHGVFGTVTLHPEPFSNGSIYSSSRQWSRKQSPVTSNTTDQSKAKDHHSHESGFQSATSLTSLEGGHHQKTLHQGSLLDNQTTGSPTGSTLTGSTSGENDINVANQRRSNYGGSQQSVVSSSRLSSVLRPSEELLFGSRRSVGRQQAIFPSRSLRCQQPYWTLKPLFFEVPNADPDTVFIGRQWLYREMSEHLSSELPTNRGVVVVGGAGSGKTAIVLQMVEHSCFGRAEATYQDLPTCSSSQSRSGVDSIYSQSETSLSTSSTYQQLASSRNQVNSMRMLSGQVVAYHFCQADNAPTCLVPEFVHSVAAQMSQAPQLTPYYQLMLSDTRIQGLLSLAGCVSDPSGAFVKGVLEPLHALRRLGRLSAQTCIIVIDGLCEAEIHRPDYGDTLANFLCKHLLKFPSWLKIVCTVRTGMQDITKLLPFQRISLDKTDVDERLAKDMTDYLTLRINRSPSIMANITPTSVKIEGSPQARFANFMVQASHGCFLYTKMTLDLIERGHLVVKSSSFNVLPLTLSEIFLLEFNLKFATTRAFEKVQDILATALAALTPLTPLELFNSINALTTGPQLQWGEFLIRFSALAGFLVRRADDTVMFYHPIFREWLFKRHEGEKFLCDPRNGHAAIAFRMSRSEGPLGPDRTLDLGHHILKAHIYKNTTQQQGSVPARDLQAMWVAQATDDVSLALGAVRNVASPNVKVSRLLLLAGASPDYISDYLDNAPLLCVFANQGFVDMVSLLIEFGGDVNASNANGLTGLMFAASQGHLEIVRLLLQHGATVNLTDKSDTCALVVASKNGHLSIVSHLVTSCDWITDEVHDLGLAEAAQQAVIAAARSGHDQVLEYLLDMSEVSVNGADTLTGDTALTAAASAGQKTCCDVLIRRGASVTSANLSDVPPLHAAVSGGHWAVTETLLKEGAQLEQKDNQGRTVLMAAAAEGHSAVVELLVTKKANLYATDQDGRTAMQWAALGGKLHAVNCLLDQASDFISHADKSGKTALDLAAANGHADVVQLLLEKGANMEHVDIEGIRPLDRAIAGAHGQTVTCFLRKGAKLGPATWAMANGKPDIMLILLNKLLDDGNTLYRRGRYEDAAHRYQYAVRRLPDVAASGSSGSSTSNSCPKEDTFQQLRVHLLLNLSRCRRKQGHLVDAIARASDVLSFRPDCLEALHARARANKEAGNYSEALADLNEALRLSPSNRDVHRMIIRVKEESNRKGIINNNEAAPIGAHVGDKFKFVDDTTSEVGSSVVTQK